MAYGIFFMYCQDFTTFISPQIKRRGACENQDEGVKKLLVVAFARPVSPKFCEKKIRHQNL